MLSNAAAPSAPMLPDLPPQGVDLEGVVAEVEKMYLRQALERGRNSQQRAAELLGLTPRSLRYRLQKYGMLGSGEDSENAEGE